jgi:3'(2'), 5'-bisphosphate nucleotidase
MEYSHLARQLIRPVEEAGRVIMNIYSGPSTINFKTDGSPVTEADRAAESILLPAIAAAAPAVSIVSEENPESHEFVAGCQFFLVDPLDGTKEFIRAGGDGAFTVNIGLVTKGVPVMGIVFAPALNRLFFGSASGGAFEISSGNCRPIAVRKPEPRGIVAVASASHRDLATNQWLEDRGIKQTVSIGSSLKFCLIAAGEADVYPRYGPTMEWDTAAGDAILRAAGGNVVVEDGSPLRYGKSNYRNGPFFAFGGG